MDAASFARQTLPTYLGQALLVGALSTMRQAQVEALQVASSPLVWREPARLAEIVLRYRLPAVFPNKENAEAGGLMSYGANLPELFRRAATYVDKIFKGAKPADLPVEQAAHSCAFRRCHRGERATEHLGPGSAKQVLWIWHSSLGEMVGDRGFRRKGRR
jgi:ABC transporter substrate binding protein